MRTRKCHETEIQNVQYGGFSPLNFSTDMPWQRAPKRAWQAP